jgi:hypothetical protein
MAKDPENPNPSGKRIEVHMQEGLAIAEKKLFRHRSPGRDNYNIQHIEGDSFEENTGKWNWLRSVIDRVTKRTRNALSAGRQARFFETTTSHSRTTVIMAARERNDR